jgi:predicted nucleotidyltransferase
MEIYPDFRELLEALARGAVEFVVVGGYAVAFHARPRATKDLDLVLRRSPENLARAARVLEEFGAPPSIVASVRSLKENEIVYLGQPPVRVDLLCAIDGVLADELFARSVGGALGGVPVRIISLDDLIANKTKAGRDQDRIDVKLLERVRTKLAKG